jgi:hypothetical protein
VLVAHDEPGVAVQLGVASGCGVVAVDEEVGREGEFGFEGDVWEEGLEIAVVIAGDEAESGGGEAGEEGIELLADGGDGEGAVDDVAEEDQLGGIVFGDQYFQAVNGVLRSRDGEELAGVAMGPDVAEVEIGGDQRAVLR